MAASLSSAAKRGPAPHEPPDRRHSTSALIRWATPTSGAALRALTDSASSPLSFHYSGLATSEHASCVSMLKAHTADCPHNTEPTG